MTSERDLIVTMAPEPIAAAGGAEVPVETLELDLDPVFNFIDKFMSGIERFSAQIEKLRALEKGPGVLDQGGEPDGWSVGLAEAESRPAAPAPAAPAPATAASAPAAAPAGVSIDPQKVYTLLLGTLGQLVDLDPKMTVGDALAMARESKPVVMARIADALVELTAPEGE